MRRIFVDDSMQKHFDENGYVVADVFSDSDVVELEHIYTSNKTDETQGLQLTIKNNDEEINKRIHHLSEAVSNAPFSRILIDHKVIYSGFIAKLPNKPNEAGVHRDPSLVDETQYKSLVVWCPLVDTDEHNGALYMVSRSNTVFQGYKCFDYGQYDFKPAESLIQHKFGVLLKVKKGQAVIYDTAMLHFSFQNTTNKVRLVHSSIVAPAEAETLVYHHNKQRDTLDIYQVDRDFLLTYYQRFIQQGDLDYPLISRTAFTPPIPVIGDEFSYAYLKKNPQFQETPLIVTSPNSLFDRIRSWFS